MLKPALVLFKYQIVALKPGLALYDTQSSSTVIHRSNLDVQGCRHSEKILQTPYEIIQLGIFF